MAVRSCCALTGRLHRPLILLFQVAVLGGTMLSLASCMQQRETVAVVPSPKAATVTPWKEAESAATTPSGVSTPTVTPTLRPTPTFVAPEAPQPATIVAPQAAQLATVAAPEAAQAPTYISAVVLYAGGEGLQLRTGPNQRKLAALLKDSALMIRGPSSDAGGFRWWPVAIEPGWMAEGPRDPARSRWLAPVNAEQIGAGQQARVVYAGPDGLNLRRQPGPAGAKVATLLAGSTITVAGEARVVDGVTWWPVEVTPGWIAEGTTDTTQSRWLRLQGP